MQTDAEFILNNIKRDFEWWKDKLEQEVRWDPTSRQRQDYLEGFLFALTIIRSYG